MIRGGRSLANAPMRNKDAAPEPAGAGFAGYLRAFDAELDYVCRALRRHGVPANDAEDLAQEVFLTAWRRWADYDVARPVRPWLAGIACNVAHRHRRRRKPEILGENLDRAGDEPGAEQRLVANDARALVLQALADLPERHRVILIQHDLDGLSVEEIGRASALPRFTVYTRLRRARSAFDQAVERLETATSPANRRLIPAPAALLALERELPSTPAAIRRRLRARLQQALAHEAQRAPGLPTHGAPGRGSSIGQGAVLAALPVLALLGAAAVWSRQTPAPAQPAPAAPETREIQPPLPSLPASARATPPAPPALITPLDLGRDLVGHWAFDDRTHGAEAADSSGLGHPCQLRHLDPAAAWVEGGRGGAMALAFNGWLECPQPALPRRPGAAMTVAAWVKRAGNPRFHHAIAMRPAAAGRSNYFFFGFVDDQLVVSGSGWEGTLSAPVPPAIGTWMHVAFSHDLDRSTRLYVDGHEVARSSSRPRAMGATDRPLLIGGGLAGSDRTHVGQLFEGTLDEVVVYERALDEAELRALAAGAEVPARP